RYERRCCWTIECDLLRNAGCLRSRGHTSCCDCHAECCACEPLRYQQLRLLAVWDGGVYTPFRMNKQPVGNLFSPVRHNRGSTRAGRIDLLRGLNTLPIFLLAFAEQDSFTTAAIPTNHAARCRWSMSLLSSPCSMRCE